ncbi:MAG: PTS fructose transporter subunit IIA [Undibacterium sp.]|nr:PTS fructose transporter subunit IIA [Undibacterium sp.]
MIGFLLITHAPLGHAFLQATKHVFQGEPERIEAIDVIADQNVDDIHQLALAAIARLNDGAGVLVLTDMRGGTPSNCCHELGEPHEVAVIAGISLPMLLRAISYRQKSLDEVVELALAGGHNGVARI